MANPNLILWCDPITNKLYSGWGKMIQSGIPMLKQGDMVGVEIHWVNTNSFSQGMVEIPFPPSATVSLAIGLIDRPPTSGTFTLTFDGDTTDELSYNITATELQTALNSLASITAEGGVTVEKNDLLYRIVWNDMIVSTDDFTCNTQCLYPSSQSSFAQAREGSLSCGAAGLNSSQDLGASLNWPQSSAISARAPRRSHQENGCPAGVS